MQTVSALRGISRSDRRTLPPGSALPPLAQSARWVFRPIEFLEESQRRYGDTFTLRFAGFPPIVVLTDPAAIKEVFTGDPEQLMAGRSNVILKPMLGSRSLLLLDGKAHHDDRKLMMPSFHGERMHAYGQVMRDESDRMIDRWQVGTRFALQPEMQEVTLAVILRTVFGLGDTQDHGSLRRGLKQMLKYGEQPALMLMVGEGGEVRARSLHARLGRLSPWSRFKETIEALDLALREEVRARRAAGQSGEDVLSLLLEARDEAGRALDDEALVDEMKTLLVAGHETTATALTWTTYCLLTHPEVLNRLKREIAEGDEYLDAVIKEALRLHPILPMVGRQLDAPVKIGGRTYPAGVVIAPCIYLTQRRSDLWADPLRFDPDRFLHTKASPYEYFPFGGGVRRCIGMAFALYEMRTVLRQMVTRTELRLAPGYRPRMRRRGITFAMAEGLPIERVR